MLLQQSYFFEERWPPATMNPTKSAGLQDFLTYSYRPNVSNGRLNLRYGCVLPVKLMTHAGLHSDHKTPAGGVRPDLAQTQDNYLFGSCLRSHDLNAY